MSLFERLPWHERVFTNGWNEDIRDAVLSVEMLPDGHPGSAIPRAEVERLAARLSADLEDA
jgi:hypothetical protein